MAVRSSCQLWLFKVLLNTRGTVLSCSQHMVLKHYITAEPSLCSLPELGNKLDYIFGKASGSSHNIQRSTQLYEQLKKIGIFDTDVGRATLTEYLTKALNDANNVSKIQETGRVVKESLISGVNGVLKMESVWEGVKLITVFFFGK